MQSRSDSNYKGIDVSNHNGNIDFGAVKNSGIQVVYMKATEGRTMQDAYFNQNYNNAKANGLKVGFYHFYHSNSDVNEQVQNFINVTQGKQPDCKVAIDVEVTDGIGNSDRCNGVLEFARQVKEKTGWDCCLYTYTSFARESLNSSVSCFPLWIAHYGVNQPSDNGIWNSWAGFQYSDSGSVAGVGKCDVNEFNDGIFLNGVSQPVVEPCVAQPSAPQGQVQDFNCIVANDFFYTRTESGDIEGGNHHVDIGDQIKVLDVSGSRQLCLVEYPVSGGTRQAYIKNVPSNLNYRYQGQWHNGSTPEPVFQDSSCSQQIGSIDPHESATPLFRENGVLHVVYNTSVGVNTKSGFVRYNGNFGAF